MADSVNVLSWHWFKINKMILTVSANLLKINFLEPHNSQLLKNNVIKSRSSYTLIRECNHLPPRDKKSSKKSVLIKTHIPHPVTETSTDPTVSRPIFFADNILFPQGWQLSATPKLMFPQRSPKKKRKKSFPISLSFTLAASPQPLDTQSRDTTSTGLHVDTLTTDTQWRVEGVA